MHVQSASTPAVLLLPDLGLHGHTLWVIFGRPGLRALEGIWSFVGKKRQARGDEEKMERSVHMLRFENKIMRRILKHKESAPERTLMDEGSRVC